MARMKKKIVYGKEYLVDKAVLDSEMLISYSPQRSRRIHVFSIVLFFSLFCISIQTYQSILDYKYSSDIKIFKSNYQYALMQLRVESKDLSSFNFNLLNLERVDSFEMMKPGFFTRSIRLYNSQYEMTILARNKNLLLSLFPFVKPRYEVAILTNSKSKLTFENLLIHKKGEVEKLVVSDLMVVFLTQMEIDVQEFKRVFRSLY